MHPASQSPHPDDDPAEPGQAHGEHDPERDPPGSQGTDAQPPEGSQDGASPEGEDWSGDEHWEEQPAHEDEVPDAHEDADSEGDDEPDDEAGTEDDEHEPSDGEPEPSADAPGEGAEAAEGAQGSAAQRSAKRAKRKPKSRTRRPLARVFELPALPAPLKAEAREAALDRLVRITKGKREALDRAVTALDAGRSIAFLARFRRGETGGWDERRLRNLRDEWRAVRLEEERRLQMRELLRQRGGLTAAASEALQQARGIAAMEDLAAPYLPVVASRATVARGLGLQELADAIRKGTATAPLSDLAAPFVKEGGEPASLDAALGGARDILAEELSLEPALRRALQELFFAEGILRVTARSERRQGQPGGRAPGPRSAALIGLEAPVAKVPLQKVLDIRRAERERAVLLSIEPPEERAIQIVHELSVPAEHPHAGLLRAAAEDGYRRILKPLLQGRVRAALKEHADAHALEFFERSLRNILLGPIGGRRRVLGLRPDVMQGHRWCAVDRDGLPTGSGQLPHAPTAGAQACLSELKDVLRRYEIQVVAVGTTGGRADAAGLARQAAEELGGEIEVAEVPDGGTRTLEGQGPLEVPERPVVATEHRGALSLARRFQDPLAELVTIDPRALALGPHIHDVQQGSLRTLFDDVIESCVAHVGVDPNSADVSLLACLPGFDRRRAEAFVQWRTHFGPLRSKAALAAVEGVGPEAAEQAVGFLRLPDAEDPRDRTQLHPEQYEIVARMAESVGCDIETLFAQPGARRQVHLDPLTTPEAPLPLLKYVLYQATAGTEDPRPRHTSIIRPPEEINLQTIFPGLTLQGRVVRAAPFGVFVDVGMGVDALLPVPHIGDRPGIEPATIAPLGAVIQARVLDVDPKRKRLTLTMRRDVGPARSGPRGPRGPRQGGHGPRPERHGAPAASGGRGPRSGDRAPAHAGQGRGGSRPQFRSDQGPDRRDGRQDDRRREGRPDRRPERGAGGPSFQRGPGRERGPRQAGRGPRAQDDRDAPRRISLPVEPPEPTITDESTLSPEELMRRKIEQMRKRLERG